MSIARALLVVLIGACNRAPLAPALEGGDDSDVPDADDLTFQPAPNMFVYYPSIPYVMVGQQIDVHDVTGDGQPEILLSAQGEILEAAPDAYPSAFMLEAPWEGGMLDEVAAAWWVGERDERYGNDVDGFTPAVPGGLAVAVSKGSCSDLFALPLQGELSSASAAFSFAAEADLICAGSSARVDADGDGVDDIAQRWRWDWGTERASDGYAIWLGPIQGGLAFPPWASFSFPDEVPIAYPIALDVNGDGRDELAVTSGADVVRILVMEPGHHDHAEEPVIEWWDVGMFPQSETSAAGDLDGDGTTELVIGSMRAGDAQRGRAYVVRDGMTGGDLATEAWLTIELVEPNATALGSAATGDVNGDGYVDLVLGVPGIWFGGDDPGEVLVFHGPLGPGSLTEADADVRVRRRESGYDGSFGNTVLVHDLNGDGLDDLVVRSSSDPTIGELAGSVTLVMSPL